MGGTPTAAAPIGDAWTMSRVDWRAWLAPAGAGLLVLLVGANSGGYFPVAWGWTGLVIAWVAALALLLTPARVGRLDLAAAGALSAYVAWVALSRIWTDTPGNTVAEIQRDLIYPLALASALLLVRRSAVGTLLGALALAIDALALYALLTRLFPERLGTFDSIAAYRLSAPLGYWNSLGILTTMAILLTLGFTARGGLVSRHVAAPALVALAPTLYFTFSRGGVIALAFGLAALLIVDTRRLQLTLVLTAVAPFAALAVWYASRADALITTAAPLSAATHDGHRLAWIIAGLAACAAAARALLTVGERRYAPSPRVRRGYAAAVTVVAAVLLVAVVGRLGGPVTMVEHAYNSFKGPPVGSTSAGINLSSRFGSLSSNGRLMLWESAWDDFQAHPVVGSGAGSFQWYWQQHRPIANDVLDAHGLYAETLAEMGIVGLALILAAVLLPFGAVLRARRVTTVPFAVAAYVAFAAHIGADWDWEMPVLILTGLFCAAAVLLAGRDTDRLVTVPALGRYAGVTLVAVIGAFAVVGLIANSALEASTRADAAGKRVEAQRQAQKAADWAPWDAQPWKQLASIQQERGLDAAAMHSLRKAASLEPLDSDTWYQIAYSAPTRRERLHALAEFKRLNPLDPALPGLAKQARRR